jgi:hypothetical protein
MQKRWGWQADHVTVNTAGRGAANCALSTEPAIGLVEPRDMTMAAARASLYACAARSAMANSPTCP